MKALLYIFLFTFPVLFIILITKHEGFALNIANILFWILTFTAIYYIFQIRTKNE